MLQKNYWLDHSSNKEVTRKMRFRTLFCKYPFPSSAIFYNRAFMIFDSGRVSASNAWTISINECSILRPGTVVNLADETTEQIRRLLILKTNLFFAESPDEIDKFHNKYSSITSEISANTILPSFFSDDEQNLRETIQDLNSWVDRILSFDRKLYKSFCTALAAYEKALQVLSSDPTLSYSLVIFVLEALANSDAAYQATWDHISSEKKNKFEILFNDSRFSSIDSTWTNELKQVIVDTFVPGATKRFTEFTIEHVPSDFHDSQNNNSKSPIRHSRISSSVKNAYGLRSSFAHELTSLTQYLISQSNIAEEIEENNQTYLTLRGLFRLVRSVMLEFAERQTTRDLQAYNWDNEFSQNIIITRPAALYRVRDFRTGQLNSIESEHAQTWLEDILTLYQDHYVEFLHERNKQDCFSGFGTHGLIAGRAIFTFDPNPSYDWKAWKEQSLNLIPTANQSSKGHLQAIAMLCAYLEEVDSGESRRDEVVKHNKMGSCLKKFENLVVDIICNTPEQYSGEESEKLLDHHIKKRKIRLPFRVEIACMIEVARLFQNEGIIEKRNKWLELVYGDSARYPDFQSLIKDALTCPETIVKPQAILDVPQKPSFKDAYNSLINEDYWQE
jgi:hypothetical protein